MVFMVLSNQKLMRNRASLVIVEVIFYFANGIKIGKDKRKTGQAKATHVIFAYAATENVL
jgi:hypothetical protein